jgi:hypothetical protein
MAHQTAFNIWMHWQTTPESYNIQQYMLGWRRHDPVGYTFYWAAKELQVQDFFRRVAAIPYTPPKQSFSSLINTGQTAPQAADCPIAQARDQFRAVLDKLR